MEESSLHSPSVTLSSGHLVSAKAVTIWICNHDLMYFMEGKIYCIKKGWEWVEVARLSLMPDLHVVTTLLYDCFIFKRVCLFQLPWILYIICCYIFFFNFLSFLFFCLVSDETSQLAVSFSISLYIQCSCVNCIERILMLRNTAFIRETWQLLFWLVKGTTTINLALFPLLKHINVDILCFFFFRYGVHAGVPSLTPLWQSLNFFLRVRKYKMTALYFLHFVIYLGNRSCLIENVVTYWLVCCIMCLNLYFVTCK